jgi:hypothetical protein
MKRLLFFLLAGVGAAAARAEEPAPDWEAVAETVHREVLSAHGQWRAFQENRDRTNLLTDIERCYQRALVFEPVLKRIPVELCDTWLEKGTAPDAFRPTLYDAVVYDLLAFYAACGGDDGVRADGPAFDDVAGFCVPIPDEAARRSHVLRALRLYQELLAFHEQDKDPSAYADADLNRLQFCRKVVSGGDRDERYAAALDRFAHKWRRHEAASRAAALRAALARERGDAAFARMLAQNGAAAFPGSVGAVQCRNLIAEIETPSLEVYASAVWRPPWPEITVTYKNLTQVSFRAVPELRPEVAGQPVPDAGRLLGGKPVKAWTVALPPAPDYREREYRVTVPKDLPAGRYAVFASADGTFEEVGAPVSWARIDVEADGTGERKTSVAFTPLSGSWPVKREPDDWLYRTWRDVRE